MKQIESDKITRVEVINHYTGAGGREYTKYFKNTVNVEYDLQDDGKTLKLFISEAVEQEGSVT